MHISDAFTFESALAGLIGGLGIGAVAAAKLWTSSDLMPSATPNPWSTSGFILASMLISRSAAPGMFETLGNMGATRVLLSGALVGFGAGLGEGCTSGNGIQGLAALSKASLVFVCTFMGTGMISASAASTATLLQPPDTPFKPSVAELSPLVAVAATGVLTQLALGRRFPSLASFVAGCTFACSLILAGMVRPSRVVGFLHIQSENGWDPTLAFVMGGGLLVTVPAYYFGNLVARATPEVQAWAVRPVDGMLLLAALCFGAGWGASGLCPGPALVACGTGNSSAVLFLGAMFAAREAGASLRGR